MKTINHILIKNPYDAPETQVLTIRTDRVIAASETATSETATHDDYDAIDLFE